MIATSKDNLAGRRASSRRGQGFAGDLVELYLREAGAWPVLKPAVQQRLLEEMIRHRNALQAAFLATPAALEAISRDLERYRCGEMAASSLVPGPPKSDQGKPGPAVMVERIDRLFRKHRQLYGQSRPAHHPERRLVRAVLFAGFRPRPLSRYREAALSRGGPQVRRRIEEAEAAFLEARRPIVEHNLRLVLKLARQFFPGPLPLSDLIQEGNVGLIRATESFNLRFGVRFSTYAHLWIRQAVIRALEDKSRTIRLPVSVTQKLRKLRMEGKPEQGLSDADKARLQKLMTNPTVSHPILSLNAAPDETSDPLIDLVAEDDPIPAGEPLSRRELSHTVMSSLALLPERQRLVLRLRFGLEGARQHTLGDIGLLLGLSAERVRQIQEQAFVGLKAGPDGSLLEELAEV